MKVNVINSTYSTKFEVDVDDRIKRFPRNTTIDIIVDELLKNYNIKYDEVRFKLNNPYFMFRHYNDINNAYKTAERIIRKLFNVDENYDLLERDITAGDSISILTKSISTVKVKK